MSRGPIIRASKCPECGKQVFATWAEASLAAIALSTRDELLPLDPYMEHGVWHLTSSPHRKAAERGAARAARAELPKTEEQRAKKRRHNSRWRKTEAGRASRKRAAVSRIRKKRLMRVAWALTALIEKRKDEING